MRLPVRGRNKIVPPRAVGHLCGVAVHVYGAYRGTMLQSLVSVVVATGILRTPIGCRWCQVLIRRGRAPQVGCAWTAADGERRLRYRRRSGAGTLIAHASRARAPSAKLAFSVLCSFRCDSYLKKESDKIGNLHSRAKSNGRFDGLEGSRAVWEKRPVEK